MENSLLSVPGPYVSVRCYLQIADVGLRMRAAPNTQAEILRKIPCSAPVFVLREENGWAYGCCGGYLGWMSLEYLRPIEGGRAQLIVPNFLPEEMQLQFIRAISLFDAYSSDAVDIGFPGPTQPISVDDRFSGRADQLYPTKAALRTALESLFTQECIQRDFILEDPSLLSEVNGALYVSCGGRGSWEANITGYKLNRHSDDEIAMEAQFHFGTAQDWTCTLPIDLVRTPAGWRFSQFTTQRNDSRWIAAMGDGFDVWAACGKV